MPIGEVLLQLIEAGWLGLLDYLAARLPVRTGPDADPVTRAAGMRRR
jgi:hypothetical protein